MNKELLKKYGFFQNESIRDPEEIKKLNEMLDRGEDLPKGIAKTLSSQHLYTPEEQIDPTSKRIVVKANYRVMPREVAKFQKHYPDIKIDPMTYIAKEEVPVVEQYSFFFDHSNDNVSLEEFSMVIKDRELESQRAIIAHLKSISSSLHFFVILTIVAIAIGLIVGMIIWII